MRLSNPVKLHAPLKGAWLAGMKPRPTFTEDELEAVRREAYQRGSQEASKLLERQMLEQRAEVMHLQSQTFTALKAQHASLVQQLHAVLPELALEAAARVLAGTPLDREAVLRITQDLLSEIEPGREKIELQLHPRDLELIAGLEDGFREKYPEINFRADPELRSGDCVVRSRFGVLDGRLATKLRALEGLLK